MRILTHLAASLALTVGAFHPVAAQSVPNLSGTWVMVADKSDFGPMPAPSSRTDVIDHKEPSLTIKRTQDTPNGVVTTSLVYAVDGKPHKNTVMGTEMASVLKWDGKTLVVEGDLNTPNGAAHIVDRFTLSADGKTLTQDRAISINGQDISQKIVLAKQ